jgi:hypothetical protein
MRRECHHDRRAGIRAGTRLEIERARDASDDVTGLGVLELDHHGHMRAAARELEGKAGLADATRPHDGHPAVLFQHLGEGSELGVTSDEGIAGQADRRRALAPLTRRGHEVGAAVGAELALQARDVALDGAHGDEQLRGDLGVAQAPLDGGEDRAFAWGQRLPLHGASL